jgi:hypothetical protein
VAISCRVVAIAILVVLVFDCFLEDCGRDVGDRMKYVIAVCLRLILSNGNVGSVVVLVFPLGCRFLDALGSPIRPILRAEFWVSVPASFVGAGVYAVAWIAMGDYLLRFLRGRCLCRVGG